LERTPKSLARAITAIVEFSYYTTLKSSCRILIDIYLIFWYDSHSNYTNQNNVQSEPELTRELWRSGEVNQKRAQIRSLIEALSEEWESNRTGKEKEKEVEKEVETAKTDSKEQERVVARPPSPPQVQPRRRKQTHPMRLDPRKAEKHVVDLD
jgi:hypothetical protein